MGIEYRRAPGASFLGTSMLKNGVLAVGCTLAGLILLGLGALVPAHFRAVDREWLRQVGSGGPSLVEAALKAVADERVGTARLLLEAARSVDLAGTDGGFAALSEANRARPALARWGGTSPWLDQQLGAVRNQSGGRGEAVLDWLLPETSRAALRRPLSMSSHPAVMALMACRDLRETVILPPVGSASGQPMEAALLIAAALAETGRLHPGLSLEFERAATGAAQGRGSEALEKGLLDLLAAARRLDWEQLATLGERVEDLASLRSLVAMAGMDGREWGILFAGVVANAGGRGVANYLSRHGEAGLRDLREALGLGTDAVLELVRRGERVHRARVRPWLVEKLGLEPVAQPLLRMAGRFPVATLILKYLLWFDGLFLLAHGQWRGRRSFLETMGREDPAGSALGVHAALAISGVILLFLTLEQYFNVGGTPPSAIGEVAKPMIRARLRLDLPQATTNAMNEKMLSMLIGFFAIQMAIYMIGLSRLRSIRGRLVDGAVKLKLLDNEESMFDAPLYMGIAGSVLALVLRLTGMEGVSLMASYSSTLFGILFCFILKVMHVRPYRQRLILESSGPRE